MVFGGDVALPDGMDARDPFGAVAATLRAADLAWINLETVVAEPGVGVAARKAYVFRSPPRTLDLLREAGVDGVSVANNHALDYGPAGLARTVALLRARALPFAGFGASARDAWDPVTVAARDARVAVLGFYRMNVPRPGWTATPRSPGLASAEDSELPRTFAAIRAARARADKVVVMVHWGTELVPCPYNWQRRLARRWVRAGADLVVGSHPHVLHAAERVGRGMVLYSTGNLAFPLAWPGTTRSALFTVTLGETPALRVVPLALTDGRPAPLEGAERAAQLDALNARALGLRYDADGRAVDATVRGPCDTLTPGS
jgi:poly-gamma-glutamate synthesis protein (capsule biosynthesis protein)